MIKLSTSLIQDFKACPMRCYYSRILRLRPIEETESQRIGTHWHKLLELWDVDKVTEYLNKAYAECPLSKTLDEWKTERIILLYSFIGYKWHWGEEQEPIVESEIKFEIPLISPKTGKKLRAMLVGKIDKLYFTTKYNIREQKSTTKSLDSDSTYWNRLALDTQTTLYPYALRQMGYGNVAVEYDVWHKPQIRPKKLTQANSKKFVETGKYCGEKFEIMSMMRDIYVENNQLDINHSVVDVELGAKEGTFAIRETPEMFGARLLQDITSRPEFYFARKEIPRTDADYERFHRQLFNIYHTIRLMKNNNGWFGNESQCEATFHCPYIPICYNNIDVDVNNPPEGFEIK